MEGTTRNYILLQKWHIPKVSQILSFIVCIIPSILNHPRLLFNIKLIPFLSGGGPCHCVLEYGHGPGLEFLKSAVKMSVFLTMELIYFFGITCHWIFIGPQQWYSPSFQVSPIARCNLVTYTDSAKYHTLGMDKTFTRAKLKSWNWESE